jgi:hypothetical protein
MTTRLSVLSIVAAVFALGHGTAFAVELTGTVGEASGSAWQSAYMDLKPVRDFNKGDRILIRVEGAAEWVKVRLLPETGNPSQPTGVVGPKIKVPAGGELEITLDKNRPRIKQISVHAGEEAWGQELNPNGGDVRILGIDVNP